MRTEELLQKAKNSFAAGPAKYTAALRDFLVLQKDYQELELLVAEQGLDEEQLQYASVDTEEIDLLNTFARLKSYKINYYVGKIYLQRNNWLKAQEAFEQHLTDFESDDDALDSLGIVYEQLEQTEDALQVYSMALQINTNNSSARHNRARLYMDAKQYQLALYDLKTATTLQPKNIYFLNSLAECLLNLNNTLLALQCYARCFDAATEQDTPFVRVIKDSLPPTILALVYEIQDKFVAAREIYFTQLQDNQRDPVILNQIGSTYHKQQNYKEAKAFYNTMIKCDQKSDVGWASRGECLYGLRKYKLALGSAKIALDLNPEDKDYRDLAKNCVGGQIMQAFRSRQKLRT